MTIFKLLFVVITLCLLPHDGITAMQTASIAGAVQSIDAAVQQLADQGEFAGSVLIVKNNETILRKGYGFADDAQGTLNSPATVFCIGSITKSFTANIILQLAQEGKFSVDDFVHSIIPDYPHKNIMIHQLLTHSSGLPCECYTPGDRIFELLKNTTDVDDVMQYEKKSFLGYEVKLLSEPSSAYSYSNLGYQLLGEIIEVTDGCTYEQSLRRRIFDRLNMNHSFASYQDFYQNNRQDGIVLAQEPSNPMRYCHIVGHNNFGYDFAQKAVSDGSILSTIDDMYLWAQCIHHGTLLNEKQDNIFKTPGIDGNYACGIEIQEPSAWKVICHSGLIAHYNSFFCIGNLHETGEEFAVIVLANNGDAGKAALLALMALGYGEAPVIQSFGTDSSVVHSDYIGIYEAEESDHIENMCIKQQGDDSLLLTMNGKDGNKQCIRLLHNLEHDTWGSNIFGMRYKFVMHENNGIIGIQDLNDQENKIFKKIN